MSVLSWGILGTSFISHQIAKAISESDGNEIAAVASRDLSRAQSFAEEYNIAKAYDSQEALLTDDSIDVIYIGLPNFLHANWMQKCIDAGKHMLCEKPFTVNAKQVKAVIDSLSSSSVFCMEALMYACHPFIAKVKELIAKKAIGKIQAFDAHFSDEIFPFANSYCAGSMLDLGCYPLSLVLLLMRVQNGGERLFPTQINAVGKIDEKTNTDIFSSLQLLFSDKTVATITCSNHFKLTSAFRILGEKGVIEIKNPWLLDKRSSIDIHYFGDKEDEKIEVTTDHSLYCHEILTVAANVRVGNQQSKEIPWKDSLQVMQLLDQWRAEIGLVYEVD